MSAPFTILLSLTVALLIPGVINRTRAILSGRKGVPFFQHVSNVAVMLRKGIVTGHTSSVIFVSAPSVYLAAAFTALLFIPIGTFDPVMHFRGDIVIFAYLLALGRLALILAALDTGSSFEGMGASRDALYGAMIEPALFIAGGTMALLSGVTSFSDMFEAISAREFSPELIVMVLLLFYVFYRVLTVEAGRIPVDDPRTHLELTMIHEVMVLDYSGLDLAMITIGGWLKTAAVALLAADTVAVLAHGNAFSVPVTLLCALAVALIIGITESFTARNRLSRNTTYIVTVSAIAFVIFMVAYILEQNISII